ncbi:hypothetical protein LTR12_007405 [Friedmanniomyces endolithicus]|nr:hypothetical protein LTR74_009504 [Friedmanniomyces endolithicus]KAK1818128.1 hypothetical protein LTR12_007405 [Friedmanniomyces endolithicus]
MAEQVDQNVVIDPLLASASAPADVAANPITTATADDGNDTIHQKESASEIPVDIGPSDAANLNEAELINGVETASGGGSVAEDGGPSVTSDTEGSKADADGSEQKKDGAHHARTNSVKKPTTFSKVSATKNFLAKSSSPIPAPGAKLGEKPSPLTATVQPLAAAKPRLIAKTASTLQSVQRPRPGSEGTGAPDASKVWNKNRPVPPAPPKHFTDEELKQQYGIHLATRLQTDEGGKESKWADIDEDEEDWAPDAVVWMDGTKSTLTPAEATEAEQQQVAAEIPPAKPAEAPKPALIVKRPTELGPQKTILKPGTAALQAKQTNGATASSSTEKPSLKAKSPAPTPAKSPWASLPPVDSMSPINPPVQQVSQPTAFPTQDARAYEQQTPSQPTREIAADTFDRSWREGEGNPRELFNSANGRYEPAPEARRTSIRPDPAFRKPALLQRPSQGGYGPAEPSAAFQARNSTQMDGSSWGKRRGSSVSQGSLPSARRMSSVSRPNDLPTPVEESRRQSTAIGHEMRTSPVSARSESVKPAFAQQSPWDQQMPPRPEQGAAVEDAVSIQERVMRAKREEAKKRKLEEEERSAKEKDERLQAKLAALAGSGKSRKEREADAAAAASTQAATTDKPSEPAAPSENVEDVPTLATKPAEMSVKPAPALEEQPLPIEADQPRMAEEKVPSPLPPKPSQPAGLSEWPASSTDEAQRAAPRAHLSPRSNARAPFSQQTTPGERKQQPFGRSPLGSNDTFSGWNTTAPNGNVWGTSGIGNGTFEKAGSFAPFPTSQQTSALPPPPGMGPPSTTSRLSPQGLSQGSRSPSLQQRQLSDAQRTYPPPGIDSRPDVAWGSSRNNGPSPAPGLGRQTQLPAPIAPPSRAQLQQQQPTQRQGAISSWNNAAATLPHQYAADADSAARKQKEAIPASPRDNVIQETFKKTSAEPGRLGGPRRYQAAEYTVHDAHGSRSVSTLSPAPPSTQTQPIGPVSTASPLDEPVNLFGESTVRIPDGSRNPAHGGLPTQLPPIAPPSMQQQPLAAYQGNVNFPTGPLPGVSETPVKDQSPPPPESTTHPVHSGDKQHPHIKLPPPPPRVKLPPAAPASQVSPPQSHQIPASMPQRHVAAFGPPGAARPLVQNGEWQARFNGLFNRANIQTEVPPSPPKTPPKTTPRMHGPALAITSSTKAFMDDISDGASATVSLPATPPRKHVSSEGFTIDSSEDIVSKPAIDQMFQEERSFGSKPMVRFPRNVRYNRNVFTEPHYNVLRMPVNPHHPRSIEAESVRPLPGHWWSKSMAGILVKIPGTRFQNSNHLIRTSAPPGKRAKAATDRKPSGQIGKGKDGKSSAKASGSNTPTPAATTPAATPNAESRKASFQKAPTPVPAAPATPAVATATPPTNAEGGGRWRPQRGGHRGGRGRGAPVKTSQ